jgi:oligopeptide/dipeptide ABC transporter ATP-binding protein
MIASALICEPDLLIADEPTTALDVTIQAQILALLAGLRDRSKTSIILITHDLGVVAELADRVAVMYAGLVVEYGAVRKLFNDPKHPYTKGLLACFPNLDSAGGLEPISGQVPDMISIPEGCRFHPRCPEAFSLCRSVVPKVVTSEDGHVVRCHLQDKNNTRLQTGGHHD